MNLKCIYWQMLCSFCSHLHVNSVQRSSLDMVQRILAHSNLWRYVVLFSLVQFTSHICIHYVASLLIIKVLFNVSPHSLVERQWCCCHVHSFISALSLGFPLIIKSSSQILYMQIKIVAANGPFLFIWCPAKMLRFGLSDQMWFAYGLHSCPNNIFKSRMNMKQGISLWISS